MKEAKINNMLLDNSLNLGNSVAHKKDPFIGYLSGPLTDLKMAEVYLSLLPAYSANLSPFLKGVTVGIAHGYFLIGPFTILGPLRNTSASNFAGFLAAISIIIILTCGLWIYGNVTHKRASSHQIATLNEVNFLNYLGWAQFTSGFALGGFGGNALAFLVLILVV